MSTPRADLWRWSVVCCCDCRVTCHELGLCHGSKPKADVSTTGITKFFFVVKHHMLKMASTSRPGLAYEMTSTSTEGQIIEGSVIDCLANWSWSSRKLLESFGQPNLNLNLTCWTQHKHSDKKYVEILGKISVVYVPAVTVLLVYVGKSQWPYPGIAPGG